jgi:hypothetical protein
MTDIIIKIMVEVLFISPNKLFCGKDIDDSLKRLDKVTQDEARMAMAEILKVTHELQERVIGGAQKVSLISNVFLKTQNF